MSKFTVVFDACVFYPAPLRDFLMHLSLTDLFRSKWTADIHEEWIRNLLKNRTDLTREKLERTRQLMDSNVRDCLVTGYESLISTITLPDPNDRHVLAAAIKSHSQAIVTFNLKDFPREALAPWDIEVLHPDDFINCQVGLSSAAVCTAAKRHREQLLNPPKTIEEYLATLEKQGLPQTVSALRYFSDLL